MKLASLSAVAAALAVAAFASPAAAVECTDKQLESLDSADSSTLEKACPSLFNDDSAIDPTDVGAFTPEMLKEISPCKEATCLTELKKFVAATPDCTVTGLNVQATYSVSVKLCEAFAAGEVTVAKANELFQDVAQNISNGLEDVLGIDVSDLDDASSKTGTKLPTVSTDKSGAGDDASAGSTATTKAPASVPSPAATTPAPAATEKSGAISVAAAGLTVAAAATLASSLVL